MAEEHDRFPPEQLTRNWNELLQELRVVQTGVQILTGFLLTVPFSTRFDDLAEHQRWIYLAVLTGSVLTTCLIVAPVSFHRVLFRQKQRLWLVTASHWCARAGLVGLALVSAGVVLLVFDVVLGIAPAVVAAVVAFVAFGALWLAVPLLGRGNGNGNGTADVVGGRDPAQAPTRSRASTAPASRAQDAQQ